MKLPQPFVERMKGLLGDIEFDVFDEADVSYYCDCTKQRVENALISMGEKDMTEIIEEGKDIDVSCQFCDKIYTFTHITTFQHQNFSKYYYHNVSL